MFLDSDNLESLHQLLNFVATDVECIVVLGSKSIYQRPWCLGEMATAHRQRVQAVVLAMPGYALLSKALRIASRRCSGLRKTVAQRAALPAASVCRAHPCVLSRVCPTRRYSQRGRASVFCRSSCAAPGAPPLGSRAAHCRRSP